MKLEWMLALVCATSVLAQAPDDTWTLDDILREGQQWLEENVDETWLRALQDTDQEKVREILAALQRQFQGEYVIDLASLREAVHQILPLLESHEESQPYAAWLRARADYLDVANELKLIIPPPRIEPGQPPKPAPNPTPEQERQVWLKHVEKRPPPKGAQDFVARLKPVFLSEQVPAELVWLAEVESSWDPRARSPVGALGLFQLMPATAKQLGLALRPEDERLEPEKSARAAAKYLRYLHQQFADWPLALAAYNVGEGRLQGLLRKHKVKSFDRIAARLPAETQMYVPRIDATLRRREGVALAQLPAPRQ